MAPPPEAQDEVTSDIAKTDIYRIHDSIGEDNLHKWCSYTIENPIEKQNIACHLGALLNQERDCLNQVLLKAGLTVLTFIFRMLRSLGWLSFVQIPFYTTDIVPIRRHDSGLHYLRYSQLPLVKYDRLLMFQAYDGLRWITL